MKILKTQFRKNDLFYTLICRNDKVAMYETRQEEDSVLCHSEVARVYVKPAHTAIGVDFEEAEVLMQNPVSLTTIGRKRLTTLCRN